MSAAPKSASMKAGILLSAVSLWLAHGTVLADASGMALILASDSVGAVSGSAPATAMENQPYPLMPRPGTDLTFDLAGSETRKLQLVLDQPLSLQSGLETRALGNGSDILGLDATLSAPLSRHLSLEAGIDHQLTNTRFRSLGSIQCLNGTLRVDSYTASGCRFVNEPLASGSQRQFNLGGRFDFGNASASINWFTREADLAQTPVRQLGLPVVAPTASGNLLSPYLGDPLLAPARSDPLQYLNSEASGIDLNFELGITTDTRGDVQLGLAFSRVLEGSFDGYQPLGSDAFSWTLAEPFNFTRMNLEWSKGAFSTGIQGYYRDSVDFLNRNSLDSLATFDVHFTWRTPWNANLSVGTTNVLNAGTDSPASAENQPADPLEPVYGRIPYVRYKQDL